MGLIKAALSSAKSVMGDQWKEFFYCDSMPNDVLVVRGQKKTSGRGSNKGDDNVISSGSVISVADGQCMLIVEQGEIVDVCAEPGEFVFDASTEPSIFSGDLGDNIIAVFKNIGKRFTFGGEIPKDQRVYYFNIKELPGNKYGTPTPVPFRVVDNNIGLDIDVSLRCFGEYSYRISNPLLFYKNISGNISRAFTRDEIESQLKTELLTALQPAFAKISAMGIRYSALPGHTTELAKALNEVLSAQWGELRGLEIVSFGVSSVSISEEDEKMIKELQRNAVFRNPNMAAAHMVGAQAQAMQDAANNAGGAMAGFMGVNMAQAAGGINANSLFQMGAQTQPGAAAPADCWVCSACGAKCVGKFCPECGAKKPAPSNSWTCSCGSVNKGKFCAECGAKKPAGAVQYKCDKCGWEPADGTKPPRFCPECGDPFDNDDIV